jgi:hypothetical protein
MQGEFFAPATVRWAVSSHTNLSENPALPLCSGAAPLSSEPEVLPRASFCHRFILLAHEAAFDARFPVPAESDKGPGNRHILGPVALAAGFFRQDSGH